jgi:hypothetical protein
MVVAIAASPIRDSPVRYAVALDGLTHCQVDSLSREAEPPPLPLVVPLACHIRGSITVPSGQPRSLGSADDLAT